MPGQTLAAAEGGIKTLLPYGIGGLAVLACLFWATRIFLGKLLERLATRCGDIIAGPFSRPRGLTRGQLRSYVKAVARSYATHPLGFENDTIDIEAVYVPLQYEGRGIREDIYARIRDVQCSVVVGAAGAGKSLLLKNSMLIWARRALVANGHVPVLIDLHRCNTGTEGIADLIVSEFVNAQALRSRERAQAFVERALREGRLRLLFDGLDEVGRDQQDRVVFGLRDFARAHPGCQMVVTCRSAVYHGQLAPEFGHVVHIADFDDAGVRRFLSQWPRLTKPDAERLFGMLRANPAVMRLARSPLLLTMIVYLHTEIFAKTGRSLPTSRAAFYDRAVAHLLGRDRALQRGQPLGIYEVADKITVLQRVALSLQEDLAEDADRRSISLQRLIQVVVETLPALNMDKEHAVPLLKEIVERSQLLVALDRSQTQYAFAHLTLQEYLAACELAEDPSQLLDRYRSDPDAWIETMKLWCGVGRRDCTQVVAEVLMAGSTRHPALALECLAEARRIDEDYANRVIGYFVSMLGQAPTHGDRIAAALGALASDSSPRGRAVLAELSGLASDLAAPARPYALRALAASGRTEAASLLADLAGTDFAVREALRLMGELAVPALVRAAHGGIVTAVDDLAVIGTPSAAEALVGMLWSAEATATPAAWQLAALLRNPDVESALSHIQLPGTEPDSAWVGRPFAESDDDVLIHVIGRIASIISASDGGDIPPNVGELDTRIGLPLGVLGAVPNSRTYGAPRDRRVGALTNQLAEQLGVPSSAGIGPVMDAAARESAPSDVANALGDALMDARGLDGRHRAIIGLLNWPVRAVVFGHILGGNKVDVRREDWLTVNDTPKKPSLLWQLVKIVATASGISIAALGFFRLGETLFGSWTWGPVWLAWLFACLSVIGLATFITSMTMEDRVGAGNADLGAGLGCGGVCVGLLFVVLLGIATVADWLVWWLTLAILAAAAVWIIVLSTVASRRDRAFANPLRRCLLADSQAHHSRTSVVAAEITVEQALSDPSLGAVIPNG